MSMKNISKALAMAVMMSAFCGNAYAYFQGGSAASAAGDGVAVGVANSEDKGVAVGYYVSAAQNGVAIGNQTNITGVSAGKDSIAIGTAANAINQSAVAIGNGATASKDLGIALGSGATANGESAVALGVNSLAEGKNSVALGIASVASEDNTVSVGDSGSERRIVNVATGTKDTDAVNKKQMEDAIAAIGTATYDDTAIKADIAKKADKATTLAGYGITDGATKTELDAKADKTDLDKKADKTELDAKADKTDLDKKADKTDLDAKADKADVEKNAADIADHETRIATLEAGGSGGASTEALEKLDSKINATDARMDRVGATAAALAAINYQPMTKGQSQVAIGMGGYNGKKATAIGLAYQFDNRISGSVAGAANGSEHMFNVGFNYLFGQHSSKDVAQMAAAPGSMSLKEAELQSEVDSLKAEVAELKAMVKALAAK